MIEHFEMFEHIMFEQKNVRTKMFDQKNVRTKMFEQKNVRTKNVRSKKCSNKNVRSKKCSNKKCSIKNFVRSIENWLFDQNCSIMIDHPMLNPNTNFAGVD